MNREFLVTKFVCSDCSRNLQLAEVQNKVVDKYSEGEPTGAAMIKQVVSVVPCVCVTRKLEDLKAAARTFVALGEV